MEGDGRGGGEKPATIWFNERLHIWTIKVSRRKSRSRSNLVKWMPIWIISCQWMIVDLWFSQLGILPKASSLPPYLPSHLVLPTSFPHLIVHTLPPFLYIKPSFKWFKIDHFHRNFRYSHLIWNKIQYLPPQLPITLILDDSPNWHFGWNNG